MPCAPPRAVDLVASPGPASRHRRPSCAGRPARGDVPRLARPGLRGRRCLPVPVGLLPHRRHRPAPGAGRTHRPAPPVAQGVPATAADRGPRRRVDGGRHDAAAATDPVARHPGRRGRLDGLRRELGARPALGRLLRRRQGLRQPAAAHVVALAPGPGLPRLAGAAGAAGPARPSGRPALGASCAVLRSRHRRAGVVRLLRARHRHPAGVRLLRRWRAAVGVRPRWPAGPGGDPGAPSRRRRDAARMGGGVGTAHVRHGARRHPVLPGLGRALAAHQRRSRRAGRQHRQVGRRPGAERPTPRGGRGDLLRPVPGALAGARAVAGHLGEASRRSRRRRGRRHCVARPGVGAVPRRGGTRADAALGAGSTLALCGAGAGHGSRSGHRLRGGRRRARRPRPARRGAVRGGRRVRVPRSTVTDRRRPRRTSADGGPAPRRDRAAR